MSQHLFFALLLFFLLMMCCTCGLAYAAEGGGESKGVDKPSSGKAELPSTGGKTPQTPTCSKQPCVVVADGHLVLKGNNLTEKFVTGTAQKVIKRKILSMSGKPSSTVEKNALVLKGKKIFVYFKSSNNPKDNAESEYEFAISDFKSRTKTPAFSDLTLLNATFTDPQKGNKMINLFAGGGSGIMMKDQTLIIPVIYNHESSQNFSTIIYSIGKGETKDWGFLYSTIPAGCIHPAVVEWGSKLFMMTSCNDGLRKVYESNDMGKMWTESIGTLSRVWGNAKGRKNGLGTQAGFTTAEIEGKKVMLFTQPVQVTGNNKYQLRLWVTDNNRIFEVGTISGDVQPEVSSTLLYAKDGIFVVYEKPDAGIYGIHIAALKEELERIKQVLRKWAKQDKLLSNSCGTPDLKSLSSGDVCVTPLSTKGLVGFLSGSGDNTHWSDEYLCVNATVRNAKKVDHGFELSGTGSGVQWPVGTQGQTQRYHFANYNFALLATVAIHSVPENDTPLLGTGEDNKVLFGLSYSKDKKWKIIVGSEKKLSEHTTWELGKKYQVALVLQNGKGSVYVDWQSLDSMGGTSLRNVHNKEISYFFFGAGGSNPQSAVNGHVTVTNVLLYNRPFNGPELEALRKDIKEVTLHRADSFVHAPVGSALLFALGLWGLAALW